MANSTLSAFPSDWRVRTIGEIANVKGGKRLPKGKSLVPTPTGHPYIRVTDFRDGKVDKANLQYVPEEVFPVIKRYIISKDDIYISIVGTIGLVGTVDETLDGASLTENAAKICNIRSAVDRDFLAYYLRSPQGRAEIHAQTVGSTQPKLALFRIKNIPVALPCLAEQKAISGILRALDDKIELDRQMNQTLEAIARAVFKSWFVDFDPVWAKASKEQPYGMGEDTAALFPNAFVDSELGPIPEGWRVGRLDELLVLQRGFDLPKRMRTPGPYPILSASGPSGTHNEYKVEGPGVTTGRSGLLGEVFFVQEDFWPLNTSLWVKELRVARPIYAYHLLSRLHLEIFNAGSAVPTRANCGCRRRSNLWRTQYDLSASWTTWQGHLGICPDRRAWPNRPRMSESGLSRLFQDQVWHRAKG